MEVRSTTVGHFMDHVEGKIADIHTGEALPTGEAGEVCVRGYLVMQEYYKNPEATAKTVDADGWLHTGDMGYLDEDGNLHLSGRLKDLIIRGGENISPAEIENAVSALEMAPGLIRECKAISVPDAHYGEEICLCIVPESEKTIDADALRDALKGSLAKFKIPKYVITIEGDFPRTLTGKVQGQELKKLALKKLNL